jgi:hypothetical protein
MANETNMINLQNSTIPSNYEKFIFDTTEKLCQVGEQFVPHIYSGVVEGLARTAKLFKDKDCSVGIIVREQKDGDFIFGVKIKFIPGADEESGSWNTIWSFNAADFDEDCDKKYFIDDVAVSSTISNSLFRANLRVAGNVDTPFILTKACFKVLITWLDTCAKEGEQVSIGLDGKFEATVDVVDGIKVFNFIPDEEITNIAKSDAEI